MPLLHIMSTAVGVLKSALDTVTLTRWPLDDVDVIRNIEISNLFWQLYQVLFVLVLSLPGWADLKIV